MILNYGNNDDDDADPLSLNKVTPLTVLSRYALLHGLSRGIPVTFREEITNPIILSDERFWNDLLNEARERRLLSDAFLLALCESGIPPRRLELKGGRGDAAVTERWLFSGSATGNFHIQSHENYFSSAAEMLLSSLDHFKVSDIRKHGDQAFRRVEDELFDKTNGYLSCYGNNDTLHRFMGNSSDLSIALHAVARTCSSLEYLEVGPFGRNEITENDHGLTGALKAISASCKQLKSISFDGLVLRADQTVSSSLGSLSFFESFSQNCGSTLQSLSLSHCSGVQDRHIQSLLLYGAACPMLQSLDLSYTAVGCLSFSALSQRQPSQALTPLSRLILDGTLIDIKWLRKVVNSPLGNYLEELSLISCPLLEKGIDVWDTLSSPCGILPHLNKLSIELWLSHNHLIESVGIIDDARIDDITFISKHIELGNGDGWACCHCTLVNEDFLSRCAACFGRRYTSEQVSLTTISSKKRELLHDFPKFKSPLETFFIKARIDEECTRLSLVAELEARKHGIKYQNSSSNSEYTIQQSCATEACTKFSGIIFQSLPMTLRNLSITFPGGKSQEGNRSFVLSSDHVLAISRTYGPFLENVRFDSVVIHDLDILHEFISTLRAVKSIKLNADGNLGVSSVDVLKCISTLDSKIPFDHLELLHVTIHDSGAMVDLGDIVGEFISNNKGQEEENGVEFSCRSLKHLLLHGCTSIQRLGLSTPNLERLHVSYCPALTAISFDGSIRANKVERLRLCRNLSLDPHSLAMMRLPNLRMIHLDGMTTLQDWQLGDLANSTQNLSSMRLHQCRSLGNSLEWRTTGSSCPLNVLHIFRPSLSFDRIMFGNLFTDTSSKHIRDLRVESASGLRGVLNRETKCNNSIIPEISLNSRLGQGALDHESERIEFLGLRGIQRILTEFIQNARPGEEKGFPPTLNSYQRKIVHESAEALGLEHRSIRLNTGVKVVRVKRKIIVGLFDDIDHPEQANIGARHNQQRDYDVDFEVNEHSASNRNDSINSEGIFEHIFDLNLIDIDRDSSEQLSEHFVECFLRDFVASHENESNEWHSFPSYLSSFERKLVHEVAEDLGLEHESVTMSDGSRVIRVRQLLERNTLSSDDSSVSDCYEKPLSRKAARKANKIKKKGRPNKGEDSKKEIDTDEENSGVLAYDSLLQCEINGRIDSKSQRQLNSLAHQLPRDTSTGKTVCIRYLRGICPFQNDNEKCCWAHFNMKESALKKFGPLFDVVCGCWGRKKSFDGNATIDTSGITKKSSGRRHGRGHRNSSLGSEDGFDSADENLYHLKSQSKSRRKSRRKSSVGSDYDSGYTDDDVATSGASHQSRSSSIDLSKSSYQDDRAPISLSSTPNLPTPLYLYYLMNLDLLECDGITGISCEAPYLTRVCLRGCSQIRFLNIENAQALRILDASDCTNLDQLILHDQSFRNLRLAIFTSCKKLGTSFMSSFVNHCRHLRSLHIFGSGASEKASKTKVRQKVKTKASLSKLNSGRPNLEVITTKKEWRESISKQVLFVDGEDAIGLHDEAR